MKQFATQRLESGTAELCQHGFDLTSIREKVSFEYGCTKTNAPTTVDRIFKFRYEEYCEKLKFEPENQTKREFDTFDKHSLQFAAFHAESGQVIGCIRLVLPEKQTAKLPIYNFYQELYDGNGNAIEKFAPQSLCEISRFIVRKDPQFWQGIGVEDRSEVRAILTYTKQMLQFASLKMANELNRKNALIITEPRIARYLRQSGIPLSQLYSCSSSKNIRTPGIIDTHTFIDKLPAMYSELSERYEADMNQPSLMANIA